MSRILNARAGERGAGGPVESQVALVWSYGNEKCTRFGRERRGSIEHRQF